MKTLAPIILFVYNRLPHTKRIIEALQRNTLANQSHLFIYSDAAKNDASLEKVAAVRQYIHSIDGFEKITIIEREYNWGLANSIIDGITTIINQYETIIVLEDDMITSPHFLSFMNDGLTLYQEENHIASIHGYIYPLKNHEQLPKYFFIRGADCWGWATWKRAWEQFNPDGSHLLETLKTKDRHILDQFSFAGNYSYSEMLAAQIAGKNDSWAIRWYASTFLADMLTLYPSISFVRNIGNDNSGTHCTISSDFESELVENYTPPQQADIKESSLARTSFEKYFKSLKKSPLQKTILKIRKILQNA